MIPVLFCGVAVACLNEAMRERLISGMEESLQ